MELHFNTLENVILFLSEPLVRFDREIQEARMAQLERIDTTALVQKELKREQRQLEKQHKQMRGDLEQARQRGEQADKPQQRDPALNGKPTTLTKVRCEHCGHKRIIEQEPECPNECGQ
jgi:multidrug resistance efflux pump